MRPQLRFLLAHQLPRFHKMKRYVRTTRDQFQRQIAALEYLRIDQRDMRRLGDGAIEIRAKQRP